MGSRLRGHLACPQNSDTFSVRFSVFKNFTSATVFNTKSRHLLTFRALSISDAYRVLTSGFQLPEEP